MEEKPFTLQGASRTSPTIGDESTLLVGNAIDCNVADTLTIGASNATDIVVAADVEFLGDVTFSAAPKGSIQKRSIVIGVSGSGAAATLTTVGLSQVINIGAVLPANAMVLAADLALTPFSGNSATSVTVKIGTSGDNDAIVATSNLFEAAVDGKASAVTAGIAPTKLFVTAGAQLLATITSDVNVSTLTAGQLTANVAFVVLP